MSDCNCSEKTTSSQAAQVAAYTAMLDHWWPKGSPVPRVLPWLGLRVQRDALADAIIKYPDQLPTLKNTGKGAATDQANIEVLVEFGTMMAARFGSAPRMLMAESCCGDTKPCVSCEELPAYVCSLGGWVESSEAGACLVYCADEYGSVSASEGGVYTSDDGCY
jgi:hypothetical protein